MWTLNKRLTAIEERLSAIESRVSAIDGAKAALTAEAERLALRANQIGELLKVLDKVAERVIGNTYMFEQQGKRLPLDLQEALKKLTSAIHRERASYREVVAGAIEDAALAIHSDVIVPDYTGHPDVH